jgi:dTDP-4-amino-4,6-dideoxygalactose transaminase
MIPFSPPRIDEKTIEAVTEALRSGWITTGPKTKEFEKRVANYCGVSSVLCLSSATAGLELILRWFGVKEGDEVILPAYTYCATANVVMHCGAKPVLVDVNDDFSINVDNIRHAITPRTKVIMPVDIGGYPCDYDAIHVLINDSEIKSLFQANTKEQELLGRILVLADAAHSFGALYKGKRSGSLTDISVFSFHAVKNLTTAEGGAICFNLPKEFKQVELYRYLCCKSLHGQSKDALAKTQRGNWRYDVTEAGYKCNMTDIQAAMGLVELERYEDMLARRKHIFDQYTRFFSRYDHFQIPVYETADRTSSYHVYLLRIKNITEEQRDKIIERIFADEVTVNVHFIPLPMLSFYSGLGYNIEHYPQTYQNYACEISLPVYYTLSDEDVKTVCQSVLNSVCNSEISCKLASSKVKKMP